MARSLYCPMCGRNTISTSEGARMCLTCQATVQPLSRLVTLIHPRPRPLFG